MAKYVIKSMTEVLMDGQPVGALADAIANRAPDAALIQLAAAEWETKEKKKRQDDEKTAQDANAAAIQALKDEHAAKVQELKAEPDALRAKVAEQKDTIDLLEAGTDAGKKLKRQRERQAAIDAKAAAESAATEAQAKIDAIDVLDDVEVEPA